MTYLGFFILGLAFIGLLWNLHTAYKTQAGAMGQVPVFGATVIQIPLLIMLGIKLLDDSGVLHLAWWYYPVIWLVSLICVGGLIFWMGRLGKSKSQGAE